MSNWIYFVLIAQFIWAFTSVIDKIVISKGYIKSPLVYIVLNGLMNIFLIFLLPFVSFEPLKLIDFLVALFAGIALSAAVAVYYKAVQYDEISKIKMIGQIGPIFVLIMSFLFLGEILKRSHFIGFLFLISAGLIVSYKKVENSFKLSKAFYYMLISTFLAALYYVSSKHIFSVTGFWSAFMWLRLASFSALFVLFVPSIRNQFAETFKEMKSKVKGLLGFKMLIGFSAFMFSGYAILYAPISLVTALSNSINPLFVFMITLFASIYLPSLIKEDIDKRAVLTKILAIALIMAGILFVNL